MANNNILVIDDDRGKHGFYWGIFNSDPSEYDILPPAELSRPRPRTVILHFIEEFTKSEEVFTGMRSQGLSFPVCIADLREEATNNDLRGLDTSRIVRRLDPGINIVVCSHHPTVDEEDIRKELGERSFFFRLPFLDDHQTALFRDTVLRLIDRWNAE